MHREDNSNFLLYIEPKVSDKSEQPLNDEYVEIMELAIKEAERGTGNYSDPKDLGDHFMKGDGWRGIHLTECGAASSNRDYRLKNGMITNSLAPYYLRYYRQVIPDSEMEKVKELAEFYKNHDQAGVIGATGN